MYTIYCLYHQLFYGYARIKLKSKLLEWCSLFKLAYNHLMQVLPGKHYVKLVIPDPVPTDIVIPMLEGRMIRPGSIPLEVTRVDYRDGSLIELEKGVITDAVTHLLVAKLTERMAIPASVTDLFVLDFKTHMLKRVPKTVTHLYVHAADHRQVPASIPNYLFHMGPTTIPESCYDASVFEIGEQYTVNLFDKQMMIVHRVPKPKLEVPSQ